MSLQQQIDQLVKQLPTRSPIFLPTDRIPPDRQLEGLGKVRRIYAETFREKYAPALRGLRSRFQGRDRCFVIGNGPSLKTTDLSLLQNEITFATNGFFLKLPELKWTPTFYVVEDHLVAEDRADQINALQGPTKLFPIYLAYCLSEGPDTIFFNHRPRKSYPHGFDFSTDASQITYTGCTVTFTTLQLAFYLGFREIYLVGVDASYALPDDVKRHDEYGVGVLDMPSDDPNHFDPSYFGKGYRWHDPQVDKMLESYKEALRVTTNTQQTIYNATIGGKLEVFPRRNYESLFGNPRAASESPRYPRLLMIDSTPLNSQSATGQLKADFLGDWPAESFLQVWTSGTSANTSPKLHTIRQGESLQESEKRRFSLNQIISICQEFRPDAIYVRPVDSRLLMQAAVEVIVKTKAPFVVHMMDDWPERLRKTDPSSFAVIDRSLRWLIDCAQLRWSICDKMSAEYRKRYGQPFEALANGVDLDKYPYREKTSSCSLNQPFKLRYFGGLAGDMTLDSVIEIARAVADLQQDAPIDFRIHTMDHYLAAARSACSGLPGVTVSVLLPRSDYHSAICDSDAMVIAYNFDPASICYTRLSLANKMPECLASGAALLAYGPREVATIDYLLAAGCALVVDKRDRQNLREALLTLATDATVRSTLARKGREFAANHLTKRDIREKFRAGILRGATIGPRLDYHPANAAVLRTSGSPDARIQPEYKWTRHFQRLSESEWNMTADPQRGTAQFMAEFPETKVVADGKIVALFGCTLSKGITARVTVCRSGTTPYEGSSHTTLLESGQRQCLVLAHDFKQAHASMRVQLDFSDLSDEGIRFSIIHCHVFKPVTGPAKKLNGAKSLVRNANDLFRAKQFGKALAAYVYAQRELPFPSLDFSSRLALSRLAKLDHITAAKLLEALRQ